jgi:hypothetical protein
MHADLPLYELPLATGCSHNKPLCWLNHQLLAGLWIKFSASANYLNILGFLAV